MRLLLSIQLVALIVLLFLTYFYGYIFRINVQNIEIQGFDFETYAAPTQGFAWRSLVVCAWTVFIGIKIRQSLELLSSLMMGLGGLFALLSLGMLFFSRQLTIADVLYYWYFYGAATIFLTVLAFLFYDKDKQAADVGEYDDVLDHVKQKNPPSLP